MKKLLTTLMISSALAAASNGYATLFCSFTEPFFVIEFDEKTKAVKLTEPNRAEDAAPVTRVLAKRARLVYTKSVLVDRVGIHAPVYELRGENGKILEVSLDMKGSDGMRPLIYPYSARIKHPNDEKRILDGGCKSETLEAVNPAEE